MRKIVLLFVFAVALAGCLEKKTRELPSPCVAAPSFDAHENPCIRRPVNGAMNS